MLRDFATVRGFPQRLASAKDATRVSWTHHRRYIAIALLPVLIILLLGIVGRWIDAGFRHLQTKVFL